MISLFWIYFSAFLNSSIFILIPIVIAVNYTSADLGQYSLFQAYCGVLAVGNLFSFKYITKVYDKFSSSNGVYIGGLIINSSIVLVTSFLVFYCLNAISLINVDIQLIFYASLFSLLFGIWQIGQAIRNVNNNHFEYSLSKIIYAISSLIVIISILVIFKFQINTFIISQVIILLGLSVSTIYFLRRNEVKCSLPSFSVTKDIFKFSFKVSPMHVYFALTLLVDKQILANKFGNDYLGAYSLLFLSCSLLTVITLPFILKSNPNFSSLSNSISLKHVNAPLQLINKYLFGTLIVSLASSLILFLMAEKVFELAFKLDITKYKSEFVFILIGSVFFVLVNFLGTYFLYRKSSRASIIFAGCLLFYLVLNFVFTPIYGAISGAIIFFITMTACFCLLFFHYFFDKKSAIA